MFIIPAYYAIITVIFMDTSNNPTPPKRLYRSRNQRVLAGVCGGLAEYFHLDVAWIRIIFVLCALLGFGIFILVYLVFWLIVPLSPA